jgi:hypothetical protein
MSERLKLLAETSDDLKILSAVLQDAILRVGDIHFNRDAATLTITASRFMNEHKNGAAGQRIKTGLRFNNVLYLRAKAIDRSNPDAFIVLLSIEYSVDKKKPSGEVTLVFAGGGELKLKTELLEARLVDFSEPRTTDSQPLHPISE